MVDLHFIFQFEIKCKLVCEYEQIFDCKFQTTDRDVTSLISKIFLIIVFNENLIQLVEEKMTFSGHTEKKISKQDLEDDL